MKKTHTSWEKVTSWYDTHVGSEGHYYHKYIILPKLLIYWNLSKESSILDLACGQGVLARNIPPHIPYLGVDASPSLIQSAKQQDKKPNHKYLVADITKPISFDKDRFTHAALILALQNLANPLGAFKNAHLALKNHGSFTIVMNHPCFRIPRQSSWGQDMQKKLQYRRIDRYMSPLSIPITTHPGKTRSETTISMHWPLSQISLWLEEAGFFISRIEEWCSDKESIGKNAKMENVAREEFPLFLTIYCEKRDEKADR